MDALEFMLAGMSRPGKSSMSEANRILVVDDDSDTRWMLCRYLGKHAYDVRAVEDGEQMRLALKERGVDLVVLDLSLPGEDGLTLARYLRQHCSAAIIMLTAASEVVDRVIGLETGADDYVTKPFEPRELLARIRSVLRRFETLEPAAPAATLVDGEQIQFGARVLNLAERRLFEAGGEEIPITSMEFDLLKAFADNPDRILSREQLFSLAHNREWDPFDRSLDIRIARLRKKIEDNPTKPETLKTIRGTGYIFVTNR